MRKGWTLPVLAAVLSAGLAPSPAPLAGDPHPVVDAYRKIIVLLDGAEAIDENARQRREVVARYLFQENEARLSALGEALGTDAARVAAFLDVLEKDEGLHDADKLVFRDFLDDLAARLQEAPPGAATPALRARVAEDQDALRAIQALYQKELEKIFGRIETRGMPVRREAWETYLAFVRQRVNVEAVLAEYREVADSVPQTRGGGGPAEGAGETSGSRLPARTLLLTFDDGPHARHTARILDILKQRGIKAVFFAVGQNLGTVKKDDQVQPTAASAATRALVEAGYPLANHSFSHSFLPKLSADALKNEIELTNRMIREVAKTSSVLFRPPYGARNAAVSEAVAAHGMRSVLWNVDSRDWADPVPLSIADRVLKEVEKEKHGIVLFHDIHARTVEALPALLDALQERGYQFLTWDGAQFVVEDHGRGGPAVAEAPPATASFYNDSWAVVVGIDKYRSWPRLAYAVNDARGMKELLISRYHFKPENVFLLLDEEATRERILNVLGDKLADPARVKKDDRVLVFFAGHGVTRRLPSGKSLGYLVPVDADQASYQSQAISMTNFQDVSEAIPAKHILFVTDACYSGVALTRGGGTSSGLAYLREVTRRAVRQVLTAGGADQEVADGGPSGHSIFTWALMQGLEGKADLSGDGFITASELAAYVGPTVSSLSRQTPAFGNLVGSEGGEFVFELKHESEFLSEESGQLDQQAIALNAELEKVRARLAEKRSRNEELQKELKAGAAQLNDRGTQAFREKRYQDALKDFEESARLNPQSALFANNVGFAYYKLGRMDDAVRWFEKTLAIDPQRAVANVNLGDAFLALDRRADARKAYERYLELQPATRSADYARKKLEELAASPPPP
jgi:peptidoglycan/xylan/chitin deacetylase (PgdA/CDA1 family)/TolA-binding protein